MVNLARKFLEEKGEDLEDYDGYCLELVDDILKWLGPEREARAEIMYMDVPYLGDLHPSCVQVVGWRCHAVLFMDGLVHDAYLEEALPVDKYLRTMFPHNNVIEVTYNSGMDNERVERWYRRESLRDGSKLARALPA
jgi:hypothetical protein